MNTSVSTIGKHYPDYIHGFYRAYGERNEQFCIGADAYSFDKGSFIQANNTCLNNECWSSHPRIESITIMTNEVERLLRSVLSVA